MEPRSKSAGTEKGGTNVATPSGMPQTFFYVLTRPPYQEGEASKPKIVSNDTSGQAQLDQLLLESFDRLSREFGPEVAVHVNPEKFHLVRSDFDIRKLPAFGITNFEMLDSRGLGEKPPEIPSRWKVLRRKERRKLLRSQRLFLKMERELIESYANQKETLFHFICDLHVANIDEGLRGVFERIENEIISLKGKKAAKGFGVLKREVWG